MKKVLFFLIFTSFLQVNSYATEVISSGVLQNAISSIVSVYALSSTKESETKDFTKPSLSLQILDNISECSSLRLLNNF